ncbi:MAG TPA: fibronectin type III domain-containing protein [Terriglobales bacterium]|nr:fibronectin type III domain-containing protein [Terriglobales bacterium]
MTLIIGLCIALSVASLAQQPTTLRITDGPKVESVSSNSAQIAWTTNAAAGTMLLYGTDQNGIQRSSDRGWPANQIQPSGTNPGMAEVPWGGTTHRIQLTNLQPQTRYYFAVRSTAGENTTGMTTSNVSSFTTRGNGQAQGRETQDQYGWYQNQGGNSSAYRQGMADGHRDRNGNQARNYRGQYDNANDRADYQSGYDQSYGNRNGNGNGRPYDSRDQYGRDQNGNPNRDETGVRRDGGYYDPGNGAGPNGQYGSGQQNPAYQNGFQDGIRDGRNDFQSRRNSSLTTTANYRNATGGYDRNWGSPNQYKDMYRQGYTRGYQQGYNGQGSYEPR